MLPSIDQSINQSVSHRFASSIGSRMATAEGETRRDSQTEWVILLPTSQSTSQSFSQSSFRSPAFTMTERYLWYGGSFPRYILFLRSLVVGFDRRKAKRYSVSLALLVGIEWLPQDAKRVGILQETEISSHPSTSQSFIQSSLRFQYHSESNRTRRPRSQ